MELADQRPSARSPWDMLSQAISPCSYYYRPFIPQMVSSGLGQWSSDPEGQGEMTLVGKGHASDGTYYQHWGNNTTGRWIVTYYTGDPNNGGQYIRSESGHRNQDPLSLSEGTRQILANRFTLLDPDRPQEASSPADLAAIYGTSPPNSGQASPEAGDHSDRVINGLSQQTLGQLQQAGGNADAIKNLPSALLPEIRKKAE